MVALPPNGVEHSCHREADKAARPTMLNLIFISGSCRLLVHVTPKRRAGKASWKKGHLIRDLQEEPGGRAIPSGIRPWETEGCKAHFRDHEWPGATWGEFCAREGFETVQVAGEGGPILSWPIDTLQGAKLQDDESHSFIDWRQKGNVRYQRRALNFWLNLCEASLITAGWVLKVSRQV